MMTTPIPPLIPGSLDLNDLTSTIIVCNDFKTNSLETISITTKSIETEKISIRNDNNLYVAYSGIGSIINGNDFAGRVNFDVSTSGSDQFRIFYNVPKINIPVVIITLETPCYGKISDGNEDTPSVVPMYATSTLDYFTISASIIPINLILNPGNVTLSYMIIDVL